ncbi:hypothetical protein HC031_13420 [Planosporangium thailandense]|uniref:HTH cro/C1-type domain-containing protein n=1 Tax=Planosporangium thailandense TaxID=765197 RepID=A0ABX0XXY2_9ACTN|nr:hypothetical protein [Planosporangium thailandense]NJC70706.1 hypothetical protein [Planosporangium thailandense]
MDPGKHAAERSESELGQKINRLIAAMYPDERSRPGFAKLSQHIREATGTAISSTYLWELTTGRKQNVTRSTLTTLAKFFGVPPEYFLDDRVSARVDTQLELAVALRNRKVRSIALRADGLSEETLNSILAILNHAREIEKLDPLDEDNRQPSEPSA